MMDLHLVVADMITGVKIGLPLLVLGIMSPGPAILAISAVSIRLGRARGIMFAVGVSAGSLYWGILAALGLGGVLTANTDVRLFFQTLGGAYFLWLALKMIRSALAGVEDKRLRGWESNSYVRQLIAGFLLHVLNPKAMFVWMAVISVSVPVMQNPNPITALCVTLVLTLLYFHCLELLKTTTRWRRG